MRRILTLFTAISTLAFGGQMAYGQPAPANSPFQLEDTAGAEARAQRQALNKRLLKEEQERIAAQIKAEAQAAQEKAEAEARAEAEAKARAEAEARAQAEAEAARLRAEREREAAQRQRALEDANQDNSAAQ